MSDKNMRPLHPDSVGRETKEITRILNERDFDGFAVINQYS